jgi:hypothetical protein
MPSTSRVLYAYSLHARQQSGEVVNYAGLLDALQRAESLRRRANLGDGEVVILREIRQYGTAWELRFLSGHEHESLLLFDVENDRERDDPRGAGEIVVRPTMLYVNPESRLVALERRYLGLGAATIARALEIIGAEVEFASDLTIELNPVASASFSEELQRFQRIRQASVTLARPNYDWTDNANTLTEYAAESEGQTIALEMTAPRGGSLAKDRGIVKDIKDLAARLLAPVKSVKIIGRHSPQDPEQSLTLRSHQAREHVKVDAQATADEQRVQVGDAAMAWACDRFVGR